MRNKESDDFRKPREGCSNVYGSHISPSVLILLILLDFAFSVVAEARSAGRCGSVVCGSWLLRLVQLACTRVCAAVMAMKAPDVSNCKTFQSDEWKPHKCIMHKP